MADYTKLSLVNQQVWDKHPELAYMESLDALSRGGFDSSLMDRCVGNYEGQVLAIRDGFVTEVAAGSWEICAAGIEALQKAHLPIPRCLPVYDNWHGHGTNYCVREVMPNGSCIPNYKHSEASLQLSETLLRYAGSGGLVQCPIFRRSDVVKLQQYLGEWLQRNPKIAI
jgi:hypothetical protein